MTAVSSVAFSVTPATHQLLPKHHSQSPFLLIHIQPHKKPNLRNFCSQVQLDETTQLQKIELENTGFTDSQFDIYSLNKLLSYYSKNGRLHDAHSLFDKMPNRDNVSWSTLICGYTKCGNFLKAFELLEEMWEEGLRPNEYALGSLLKASSGLRDISIGRQLHGWSICAGYYSLDAGVQTSLITMYSNCGFLDEARRVFDGIPSSSLDDVPLWNSIIASNVSHECWVEAFQLFESMISTGLVALSAPSYTSMINACSNTKAEKCGKVIHGMLVKGGLFDETMMGNSLVTFYAKCGILEDANRLFERITKKSVVSWNAIIAGNEQNGDEKAAINLFYKMLRFGQGVQPNRITFISVLNAVYGICDLKRGKEIHACMIRSGLELETSIGNCLITMYSKCREVGRARLVFERLAFKDVLSWNSMLTGYEQNGQCSSCLELFKKMLVSGVEPDNHSFTILLSATSSLQSNAKNLIMGQAIHGYILRRSGPEEMDVSRCNALISMYGKGNRVEEAEKIFKQMREKDSYSWNAIMEACSLNGRSQDTIMIFLDKQEQGLPSDHLTMSILLTACSRLVSLNLGKQFHAFIVKNIYYLDPIQQNSLLSINNALISMYSKCGSIGDAARAFLRMRKRDVFSWTAMITGYAHHGMAYESVELFDRMKQENIKPNSVTFLGLLMACAHTGLVEDGIQYFTSMSKDHNLSPSFEHYACMVDLLGRSGQLEQAKELVESAVVLFDSKHDDCLSLWKVLLGSCHAHKNLELGVYAATKILEMEPEDETTHILLSNIYAASSMWEDSIRVRQSLKDKGLKKKEVGCSWIETSNGKHLFVAGDVSHPQREDIYSKLEDVTEGCRVIGYVPMTELVLHDVEESQKEAIIGCHSEKLAVSFSILQNENGGNKGVIRVMKNLRICGDCHSWMKCASEVENIEIVLRDSRRFHLFKNGKCSCGDYW